MSEFTDPINFFVWDDLVSGDDNISPFPVQEISFEDFESQFGINPKIFDESFEELQEAPSVASVFGKNSKATPSTSMQDVHCCKSGISSVVFEPQPSSSSVSEPQPSTSSAEFEMLDSDDVRREILLMANKNTTAKTKSDVKKFERFLSLKGESKPIHLIEADLLDEYLANFILSCKTQKGEDYEPTSIRNILSSLDRELRKHKYPHSIMNGQGPQFSLTRDAFSAKKKTLKKKGKGNKPCAASPIEDDEIDMLYAKGILGPSSQMSLLNVLWLNNCLHFGLRGTTEHYNLRCGDIQLKQAADGEEYLELNERQTKTRSGECVSDVRKITPKVFSTGDDRDPLMFYKLYASKRPVHFSRPEDPFYLSTRTTPLPDDPAPNEPWFLKQRMGARKIGGILRSMAQEGGLGLNKRLKNHSARKHLVQKLRDSNVSPTEIMQISGHKNVQSVINYSNISETTHRKCSYLLSNTRPSRLSFPGTSELGSETHPPTSEQQPNQSEVIPAVYNVNDLQLARPSLPTQPVAQFQPQPHVMALSKSTNSFNSQFYGAIFNVQNFNVYN